MPLPDLRTSSAKVAAATIDLSTPRSQPGTPRLASPPASPATLSPAKAGGVAGGAEAGDSGGEAGGASPAGGAEARDSELGAGGATPAVGAGGALPAGGEGKPPARVTDTAKQNLITSQRLKTRYTHVLARVRCLSKVVKVDEQWAWANHPGGIGVLTKQADDLEEKVRTHNLASFVLQDNKDIKMTTNNVTLKANVDAFMHLEKEIKEVEDAHAKLLKVQNQNTKDKTVRPEQAVRNQRAPKGPKRQRVAE